jgi:peptide/nickel transport system permease protein
MTTVGAAAATDIHGPAYRPLAAPEPEPVRQRTLIGQALYDTFGQTGAKLGLVWIAVLATVGVFAPLIANSHPLVMRIKGQGLTWPLLRHLSAVDVCLFAFFAYAVWVMTRRATAGAKLALVLWPPLVLAAVVVTWRYGPDALNLRLRRLATSPVTFGIAAFNITVLLALLAGLWGVVLVTIRFVRAQPRPAAIIAAGAALLMCAAAVLVRPPENVVYETYREAEKAGRVEFALRTLVPYSPNDRLRDRPEEILRPPGGTHWLGTTAYGEDMLSRMLYACRVALTIGFIATGIATVIGVAFGGVMGYFGGMLDLLGMRFVEIVEAIPTLILLLIVTVFFGRNLYLMMVVIGLITWTSDARFIRAEFLKLRNQDFVHAAVAAGLGRFSIIFRHMLPNGVAPVLVNASFGIASAISLESVLSFLGLGLGPDDPSWGQLLEQARTGSTGFNWWIATFPGAAIFLTVFSYILIGESMRDAIDPRLRKRD